LRVNLVGKRFGKLVVIEKHSVNGNGETQWLCQCDCGNTKIVSRGNLKSGNTKSCGCLHKEVMYDFHKHNIYDLSGEFGIGWTTNTCREFWFDIEEYNNISDYCWIENDQGYIVAYDINNNEYKHLIRQHRFILKIDDYREIDHKNTKRYDNRKQNLRIANKQQNGMNRPHNINNKLKHKGISQIGDKYQARIMKDGKSNYLGIYVNLDDAIQVRENEEIKLFGEFAYSGGNDNE
jgi:hypothetical protein